MYTLVKISYHFGYHLFVYILDVLLRSAEKLLTASLPPAGEKGVT